MKFTIITLMMLMTAVSALAQAQHYYTFDLSMDAKGIITNSDVEVVLQDFIPLTLPDGDYQLQSLIGDSVQSTIEFDFPFDVTTYVDYIDETTGELEGEVVQTRLDVSELRFEIPYNKDVQSLQIVKDDKVIHSIDVRRFSQQTLPPVKQEKSPPQTDTTPFYVLGIFVIIMLALYFYINRRH